MGELDNTIFQAINGLAQRSLVMDQVVIFITRYAVFLLALLALIPWMMNRWRGRDWAMNNCAWRMPVAGFVAVLSALLGNWVISWIWLRPRPFVDWSLVHRLIEPPLTSYSFPSSHSAGAFAIAFTVIFFHRRYGIILVVIALLIALSRVYVGVHYPLDVLVGAGLGAMWALLAARLFGANKCRWQSKSNKINS